MNKKNVVTANKGPLVVAYSRVAAGFFLMVEVLFSKKSV
jgi:homoserine dehydrogenase